MADEQFTTMRVYKGDLDALLGRLGKPQYQAFRLAVREMQCSHPEDQRQYITAELPQRGVIPFKRGGKVHSVAGFYCNACHFYIFPDDKS